MRLFTLSLCLLSVLALTVACTPAPEQDGAELTETSDAPQPVASDSRLGGCIQTTPVVDVSAEALAPTGSGGSFEVVASNDFPPFTKKLVVHGLTLIARDEIDDEFLQLIAQTTDEIFPQDEKDKNDGTLDLEKQQEIRLNQLRYGALIPVPIEEQLEFLDDEPAWPAIEARYSVCDIIMAEVPNQVMEVVEHILHYVTDIGLHHTYPQEWGISETSELRKAMELAIERGYYVIDSYQDIDDLEIRDRVLMQEFAYWFISTAWDLQEDYGPREEEWQIRTPTELTEKLPEFFAVYQRTVGRTMTAPSRETLEAIGPTRY